MQYKIEIYLPEEFIESIVEEVTKLGACQVGDYTHVASYYPIKGSWCPNDNAQPVTGEKNKVNYGTEYKLEIRCAEEFIESVIEKVKEIHPYEEVLMNVIQLHNHIYNLN